MSINTRHLLEALEEYERALNRQALAFRSELEPLRTSWLHLSSVYEGTAAEQFRQGWESTARMLDDYLATTERLLPIIKDRIESLRKADREDPAGPS